MPPFSGILTTPLIFEIEVVKVHWVFAGYFDIFMFFCWAEFKISFVYLWIIVSFEHWWWNCSAKLSPVCSIFTILPCFPPHDVHVLFLFISCKCIPLCCFGLLCFFLPFQAFIKLQILQVLWLTCSCLHKHRLWAHLLCFITVIWSWQVMPHHLQSLGLSVVVVVGSI